MSSRVRMMGTNCGLLSGRCMLYFKLCEFVGDLHPRTLF